MFFGGPGIQYLIKLFYVTKEPPNPIYGNLDPLEFINKEVTGDQVYKLNTKNGKLPGKFPYKIEVYKYKPVSFSYLAGENAEKDALFMGYDQEDLITDLKGTVYRWRRTDTSSFLEIDIHSRRFYADSDIAKNTSFVQVGRMDEQYAKSNAIKFFEQLSRMDETYENGDLKVTFAYIGGNKLFATTALRDVQYARVDLYRKIGDYVVLGTDPKVGNLNVLMAIPKNTREQPIVYPRANAVYKEIDITSTPQASYPLIDITTAWEAVKNGKGVITSARPSNSSVFDKESTPIVNEILIDNIYLAYYESSKEQTYIQPIYVFEGKYKSLGSQGGDIAIYLPAISGEYVKPIPKDEAVPVSQAPQDQ